MEKKNVQQTLRFTPLVLELSLIGFISSGENSAHFLQLMPFTIFLIFRSTRYPLLLGGQRQYGMRNLPDTSIYDQQWESNPRPSDLMSNALSTWPHAPKLQTKHKTAKCLEWEVVFINRGHDWWLQRQSIWKCCKMIRCLFHITRELV